MRSSQMAATHKVLIEENLLKHALRVATFDCLFFLSFYKATI